MAEIEVKIKADVTKVVNLVDNDVISLEDGRKSLEQFKKEDLIEALLSNDFEDTETSEEFEEDNSEDEFLEKEIQESKTKIEDKISPLIEDDEDDFSNSLD